MTRPNITLVDREFLDYIHEWFKECPSSTDALSSFADWDEKLLNKIAAHREAGMDKLKTEIDCLQNPEDYPTYPNEAYWEMKKEKDKQIAELVDALEYAIEWIGFWGSYASEYSQDKHELGACIREIKKIIEKHKQPE